MFDISINNIVTLSRGDSFECPLFLNAGTDTCPLPYQLGDGEYIYFFLLRPNQCFENATLRKRYDNTSPKDDDGNILISFEPKDTINLCPGTYYYEIKAYLKEENGSGLVNTVVEKTKFIIL